MSESSQSNILLRVKVEVYAGHLMSFEGDLAGNETSWAYLLEGALCYNQVGSVVDASIQILGIMAELGSDKDATRYLGDHVCQLDVDRYGSPVITGGHFLCHSLFGYFADDRVQAGYDSLALC